MSARRHCAEANTVTLHVRRTLLKNFITYHTHAVIATTATQNLWRNHPIAVQHPPLGQKTTPSFQFWSPLCYVHVTSNLVARVAQHKERTVPGFTER
jgi:hypothetical protein